MLTGQNTATSGNISGLIDKAGAKIASAIKSASDKTGVDFSYLMQQAQIESSFKADAKSCSSSATGLYQFIDSTWLSMVNKYGDKYGLSDLADQINDSGKVASKAVKQQILDLRKDPEICSLMAAEMASDNKDYLENCTNKDVGATELYMAHFMGPAGASKFLKAMDKNPDASAAALFPNAAAANKNVFYDKSGNAKTLEQVYAQFDKKFELQDNEVACSTAPATQPVDLRVSDPVASNSVETDAIDTAQVLASMTPTLSPLASRMSHSLFSNMRTTTDTVNSTNIGNTVSTTDTAKSALPSSLFSLISPVDVLELLKSQGLGHKSVA